LMMGLAIALVAALQEMSIRIYNYDHHQ